MTTRRRSQARRRALRAAMVATLGVGMAASVSGCEMATEAYCDVFERNRYCCEEVEGGHWDSSARLCDLPHAISVPGPFVPPAILSRCSSGVSALEARDVQCV